jgi:hypothetical protein
MIDSRKTVENATPGPFARTTARRPAAGNVVGVPSVYTVATSVIVENATPRYSAHTVAGRLAARIATGILSVFTTARRPDARTVKGGTPVFTTVRRPSVANVMIFAVGSTDVRYRIIRLQVHKRCSNI